jgi:NAD(P)-dependent dehydrogenase (short-subunit alcohol dehydrogenase family)
VDHPAVGEEREVTAGQDHPGPVERENAIGIRRRDVRLGPAGVAIRQLDIARAERDRANCAYLARRTCHRQTRQRAGTRASPPELSDPQRWWERHTPLGRRGDPDDVASMVAYLCSAEAGIVTGASILVDGGWLSY